MVSCLAKAAAIDLARKKGQTPSAYQETLLSPSIEEQSAWDALTQAYNIARYGVNPPTREQVQMAVEAFAKIEPALQKQQQEHMF